MLSKISLITAISFAVTYPLCFWINAKDPLKQNFHRFHIGLLCFIVGIVAVVTFVSHHSDTMKLALMSWAGILFLNTFLSWKKETPNPFIMTIPCVWGMLAFA